MWPRSPHLLARKDLPPVADVLIVGALSRPRRSRRRSASWSWSRATGPIPTGTWAHAGRRSSAGRSAGTPTRDAPQDYPVTGPDADIRAVMFNGVGGSMISWAGMWHPLMPSDFRVRGRWRRGRLAHHLRGPQALLRSAARTMGVSGLDGGSAQPAHGHRIAAAPAHRQGRPARGPGDPRGLALVAGHERDRQPRAARAPSLPAVGHVHDRLRPGRCQGAPSRPGRRPSATEPSW